MISHKGSAKTNPHKGCIDEELGKLLETPFKQNTYYTLVRSQTVCQSDLLTFDLFYS